MSERFFRYNRPGYPHPVSSELENSGIRVMVGDCSVTESRRWRPPYQTDKTVHVHAKHYKHNEDGGTAQGVCGNGSVLLSHLGNVVTRIGIHTRLYRIKSLFICVYVSTIFTKINYRIYPKYSDTLNVRTPSFFLKRHLFYVPYISGHVPYRVFLLSVNVRTPKTCPLFLIKLLFFTT